MQVNSALVILGGAQNGDVSSRQINEKSAFQVSETGTYKSESTSENESSSKKEVNRWQMLQRHFSKEFVQEMKNGHEFSEKLRNGEFHPLDTGSTQPDPADPRFVKEGTFAVVNGPQDVSAFVVRDAVMGDRQGALMNAYHHGMDLLNANQAIEARSATLASRNTEIASLKDQLAAGEGDSDYNSRKLAYLQDNNYQYVERLQEAKNDSDGAMASLSRLFSQTDNGLDDDINTTPTAKGFEITHGTYGKLMEVSEHGEITMFDSRGNGYTREEFVEQQPDGMIGEMHNDLIREEDRRQRKAEREERHEKIRNGEIEGSWILEVPEDYYI